MTKKQKLDENIYKSVFNNLSLTFSERVDLASDYAIEQVDKRINESYDYYSDDFISDKLVENDFIVQIENKPYLEDMFFKMSPATVKKHNDWYQNGFLYIRFLNDYIEIKTEGADKIIRITNDEQSLYTYLNYLKNFTLVGKVNKPQIRRIDNTNTDCKKCG